MSNYEYDIGIIGGGAAGLTIASGAAQLGARTLLIEQEEKLGGDCLHYGCVPSKTLIKSAHVYHQMKHAQSYGLPKVNVPPVDFITVAERIKKVIDEIQVHDSEERFCGLGVNVVFGQARFINEHTVDLDGRKTSADKWVISTGFSPSVPPINGLTETPFLTNKEIFYMKKLPASMIILGAGPIGIEMAQAFNRLGSKITVIDMAAQILGKEDKDMADEVMGVMAREGVEFVLNASIIEVKDLMDARQVTIAGADGTARNFKAGAVLSPKIFSPTIKKGLKFFFNLKGRACSLEN